MKKYRIITNEEYLEYKSLRKCHIGVVDKFSILKLHISRLLVATNAVDYSEVTLDDIMQIIIDITDDMNECSKEYEKFIDSYVTSLIRK